MHLHHLKLLACPACYSALRCVGGEDASRALIEGTLACDRCGKEYPVTGGIPRFVPRENYASGFGLEWTRHARTQYDSYSGIPVSEQRLFSQTRWPRDLR